MMINDKKNLPRHVRCQLFRGARPFDRLRTVTDPFREPFFERFTFRVQIENDNSRPRPLAPHAISLDPKYVRAAGGAGGRSISINGIPVRIFEHS